MHAIAVGGLDEEDVGLVDRRRIGQHGPAVAAEVAAEEDRLARRLRRARARSAEPSRWPALMNSTVTPGTTGIGRS